MTDGRTPAATSRLVWAFTVGIAAATAPPALAIAAVAVAAASWLAWYERGRHDPDARRDAVRRWIREPARALALTLAVALGAQAVFSLKHASFLWEALPPMRVGAATYAWPGVYSAEILQDDDGRSWYATGGPYVPLPDDPPVAAAARVVAYLRDRFGLSPDPAHVENVLAERRGEPAPPELANGAGSDHPYTAGLAALQDEYHGAALRTLLLRSWAVVLALLLAGTVVIRAGTALAASRGPPSRLWRWIQGIVAVAMMCVAVASLSAHVDVHVYRAGAPLFTAHAAWFPLLDAVALGVCAVLFAASLRAARRFEASAASAA